MFCEHSETYEKTSHTMETKLQIFECWFCHRYWTTKQENDVCCYLHAYIGVSLIYITHIINEDYFCIYYSIKLVVWTNQFEA